MGMIFRDDYDDQQDSLMKTMAVGNTWQFRIFRIKAILYGALATAVGTSSAFIIDYGIYKWTDSAGLISWLLG